ncbi:AAA family ATPase [Marinomonas ostreistagni]|uniref:AAA family ATPase n=1 Tax=Marinomonas ostreistagni TaxID=359209 RepID=UPI001951BDDC|nr:ATP-binding protein [Marinomonas ostreistagni]MBM6550763.1 ATP-binding protein [Marinomonas ostreistagni]
MLLEYGFENFFGFKEGANISFRVPEQYSNDSGISKLLCIKGKNASGKTNLIKALSFLSNFCTKSFDDYEPDDLLNYEPFFDSEDPSNFFVNFIINNTEYVYELSITESSVLSERLYRKNNRKTLILERIDNEINYSIASLSILRSIKLRKNVSLFSIYKQHNLDSENKKTDLSAIEDTYIFFNKMIFNVSYTGLEETGSMPSFVSKISKIFYERPEALEFTKNIIKECDTGITDIKVFKRKNEESGKISYVPLFYHSHNKKDHKLHYYFESTGTRSLYDQLGKYEIVLQLGGILCLDEFDINLHPHILPKLISLFEDKETNPNDAQLIFTTHNTEIIDHLGKYKVYLVEKENNECFSYRLDEIPGELLRNDRSIARIYNSGKIGGTPKI